jgi:uncharacterized protein YhbP (UPF0306 family)
MSLSQLTRQLIENQRFITLATVDAAGFPWSSTVYYVFDWDALCLFFRSDPSSRHMQNILTQSSAAGSIYSEASLPGHKVAGIQLAGKATLVTAESQVGQIERLHLQQLRQRRGDPSARLTYAPETSTWTWVRIKIESLFYYDTRYTGYRREEISLNDLLLGSSFTSHGERHHDELEAA